MKTEEANVCPVCKEPNVHPQHTSPDGIRFRRCPECLHSWFMKITPATSDGETT